MALNAILLKLEMSLIANFPENGNVTDRNTPEIGNVTDRDFPENGNVTDHDCP
jgi:hypothetical protein